MEGGGDFETFIRSTGLYINSQELTLKFHSTHFELHVRHGRTLAQWHFTRNQWLQHVAICHIAQHPEGVFHSPRCAEYSPRRASRLNGRRGRLSNRRAITCALPHVRLRRTRAACPGVQPRARSPNTVVRPSRTRTAPSLNPPTSPHASTHLSRFRTMKM